MDPRIFFNFALLMAGLFIVAKIATSYPNATLALVCLVFMAAAISSFVFHFRIVNWPSKWSVIRRVRTIRKGFLAPPVALMLYAGCLVMAFAGVMVNQTGWRVLPEILLSMSVIVLGFASSVDWYCRAKYLFAPEWVKKFRGWILGFLGATTWVITNILSNHAVFSIAKADAARMPEFVRIASAAIFPVSFVFVVAMSLAILMIFQSTAMMINVLAVTLARYPMPFFSQNGNKQFRETMFKLLKGRKPPQKRSWWDKLLDGTQFFLRPLGTLAVMALAAVLLQTLMTGAAMVPDVFLQRAIVAVEYHTPHLCENVKPDSHIALQDDGYVSVATAKEKGYEFTLEKCHKQ